MTEAQQIEAYKEMIGGDLIETHYRKIGEWVEARDGCGSARAMQAFILSLFDGQKYRYSLSSCLRSLDSERSSWVLFLTQDYIRRGESPELCRLARHMLRLEW